MRVVAVAVVFGLAGFGVATGAPRGECRATAVIDGDGELVDAVTTSLERRGVVTIAAASCPAATATLARRGDAIVVTIKDADGRRSERSLADVDAATAVIESWARRDINAMSLVGWVESLAPMDTARIVVAHRDVAPIAGDRVRDPLSITAAVETSFGFAGGTWIGARGGACVAAGPLCLGATARVLGNAGRASYDVLVGAELPIAIGERVVASAGLAVGPGWFAAARTLDGMDSNISVGFRADAHAGLSIALARHVALDAGIAIGWSPSAPVLLRTGDAPITNDEPAGFVRADLGLRIGAM